MKQIVYGLSILYNYVGRHSFYIWDVLYELLLYLWVIKLTYSHVTKIYYEVYYLLYKIAHDPTTWQQPLVLSQMKSSLKEKCILLKRSTTHLWLLWVSLSGGNRLSSSCLLVLLHTISNFKKMFLILRQHKRASKFIEILWVWQMIL